MKRNANLILRLVFGLWNACPSTGEQVEVIYDPMDAKKYVILFEGE